VENFRRGIISIVFVAIGLGLVAHLFGTALARYFGIGRGRGSSLKGKKVAPKYRGPGGETWAGRGATPRWLVAALKGGKKREDFLIEKATGKGTKRRKKK
jgi:hypothetical protein